MFIKVARLTLIMFFVFEYSAASQERVQVIHREAFR